MNIDGSNRQKLASNEGNYINARFAPDNKISYVIYVRSSNDGIESTKLYTMNIDGSDKKLIIGN